MSQLLFLLLFTHALGATDILRAVTTVAEAEQQTAAGMGFLQAADTSPQQTVAAALSFTGALGFYRSQGDTDKVCELQADIYWCKKRMDLDSLQSYLVAKDEETKALAETMVSAVDVVVPLDQAANYLARAQKYALAHADQHLQIAIRYFEVADRFVGTPTSIEAQRLSLAEQRQVAAITDIVGAQLRTQLTVPGDLPPAASKILTDLNVAMATITAKGSQSLQHDQQLLIDVLAKEADAAEQGCLVATLTNSNRLVRIADAY